MKKYVIKINNKIIDIKKYIDSEVIEHIRENREVSRIISYISIIIAITILIVAIQRVGINSESELISEFEIALKEDDINKLSKIIKVESDKVDGEKLIPVINYLDFKDYSTNFIISDLINNGKSLFFEIENERKLFGENFYININKVDLNIKSEVLDTIILIEEEDLSFKNEVKTSVIPGLYNIVYKLETDYGDASGSKEIAVLEDKIVELELDVRNITLQSNFEDAEVIINGEKINKKVSEFKSYGPIPNGIDITMKLEKDSPWGKLESDEINIKDETLINLNVNIINDEIIDDIKNSVDIFYRSVFEAASDEDYNKIQRVNDDVKFKIYTSVFEKSIIFKDNYIIEDFYIDLEKSECEYVDEMYRANILTKVNYEVSKKILPFIKEEKEEVFLINLIYDDSEWVIEDFQGL